MIPLGTYARDDVAERRFERACMGGADGEKAPIGWGLSWLVNFDIENV